MRISDWSSDVCSSDLDMSLLIVNHLDTMMEITTLYIQSQKDVLAVTNMTDLLMVAARSFPAFVSEVISMVTDTPELRDRPEERRVGQECVSRCRSRGPRFHQQNNKNKHMTKLI